MSIQLWLLCLWLVQFFELLAYTNVALVYKTRFVKTLCVLRIQNTHKVLWSNGAQNIKSTIFVCFLSTNSQLVHILVENVCNSTEKEKSIIPMTEQSAQTKELRIV